MERTRLLSGQPESIRPKIDRKMVEWQKLIEPYRGTKIITYHKIVRVFRGAVWLVVFGNWSRSGIEPSPTHINTLDPSRQRVGVKLLIVEPYARAKRRSTWAHTIGVKLLLLPEKSRRGGTRKRRLHQPVRLRHSADRECTKAVSCVRRRNAWWRRSRTRAFLSEANKV